MPRGTRSGRHRVPPCDLPTRQTMSTPLDRGSTVPLCAVCIEAGRATEATYQTRDGLCGCDEHIQELERDGRAAVRGARRSAVSGPYEGPSVNAAPAGRTLPGSPDFSAQQNTVLPAALRPLFDLDLILIRLAILRSKFLPVSWLKSLRRKLFR
jgi:hypothetical protein